jgi:anti-anti-sigma regulatory factor
MGDRIVNPKGAGPKGHVAVRWMTEDTLEFIQSGHLTEDLVEQLLEQLKEQTQGRTVSGVLSDLQGVTGLDPVVVQPGAKLLDELKRLGVRRIVLVAPSPLVRMTATALGLSAGVAMKMFASRAEAEHFMKNPRG